VARDARNQGLLEAGGWRVLVIWKCELKDLPALRARVRDFLEQTALTAHDEA
jgi:DNA mismatch endonuclease (patch repair protein)